LVRRKPADISLPDLYLPRTPEAIVRRILADNGLLDKLTGREK
jgi:hypothetical protein